MSKKVKSDEQTLKEYVIHYSYVTGKPTKKNPEVIVNDRKVLTSDAKNSEYLNERHKMMGKNKEDVMSRFLSLSYKELGFDEEPCLFREHYHLVDYPDDMLKRIKNREPVTD